VLAPANDPRSDQGSSVLQAVIAVLNSRAVTLTPVTIVGTGVYLQTGQVRQALLVWLLGAPAVAGSQVLVKWVRLLEPPRRWRRPRRRGS
jgi:hypothetical protein